MKGGIGLWTLFRETKGLSQVQDTFSFPPSSRACACHLPRVPPQGHNEVAIKLVTATSHLAGTWSMVAQRRS